MSDWRQNFRRAVLVATVLTIVVAGCRVQYDADTIPPLSAPIQAVPPLATPQRVLVIGDSIVGQAGPKAGTLLAMRGYDVTVRAVGLSGLVSGPVKWHRIIGSLLDTYHPNILVVQFQGVGWFPAWPEEYGGFIPTKPKQFFAAWKRNETILAQEATRRGVTVYLGSPLPLAEPPADVNDWNNGAQLWQVHKEVAAEVPGVRVVNSGASLGDARRVWMGSVAGCDGNGPLALRHPDKLHLDSAGATRLGGELAERVSRDYGTGSLGPVRSGQAFVDLAPGPNGDGYYAVACDAGVYAAGNARFAGPAAPLPGGAVGIASTADGLGYWVVDAGGVVNAFGTAQHYGDAAALGAPAVAIASSPTGAGYWILGRGGEIASFGDAVALGPAVGLSAPAVGLARTTSGNGLWVLGADGHVVALGDATFLGDTFGPGAQAVGIASSPTGAGYWILSPSGDVAAFGAVVVHSTSMSAADAAKPVSAQGTIPLSVAIAATPTGAGYWIATRDGRVLPFGDATDHYDLGFVPEPTYAAPKDADFVAFG